MDPVSLEELRDITPLAVVGLLHKVGWALRNESVDLHYHPLRRSMCSVDNHLLVIEHDQNYVSFVVSVLFHKTGEGEALILNFGRWERRLFEGGAYLRGGANSRIDGICIYYRREIE